MNSLVVGFLFSPDKKKVVLIKKNRPAWQKELYNGIGGHATESEVLSDTMIREFKEEAGLIIPKWKLFAKGINHDNPDTVVYFYKAFDWSYIDATTQEDEKIYIKDVYKVKYLRRVYNLDWLIPLALDDNTSMTTFYFTLPNKSYQP